MACLQMYLFRCFFQETDSFWYIFWNSLALESVWKWMGFISHHLSTQSILILSSTYKGPWPTGGNY